jgi:hypothetical protein
MRTSPKAQTSTGHRLQVAHQLPGKWMECERARCRLPPGTQTRYLLFRRALPWIIGNVGCIDISNKRKSNNRNSKQRQQSRVPVHRQAKPSPLPTTAHQPTSHQNHEPSSEIRGEHVPVPPCPSQCPTVPSRSPLAARPSLFALRSLVWLATGRAGHFTHHHKYYHCHCCDPQEP